MWKIFYLLLMPIFYKLLHYLFLEDKSFEEQFLSIHGAILVYYYLLETVYIFISFIGCNELIFVSKDYESSMIFFTFSSIIFITVHLFYINLTFNSLEGIPVIHCGILTILFIFFLFFNSNLIQYKKDELRFDQKQYQVIEENIIELEALGDAHTTTGIFYMGGRLEDNYELYYSYINGDSLEIDSIRYNKEYVKIHPEENCINPRIETKTYYKEYKSFSDSYQMYDIYIPKNAINSIDLNFE